MNYEIIIKPVIGAIIGYTTNWLAIKMLFRPYKEKYIGKLRVPLTPGVIPRERERIAKSLGTAVGNKLLTEEVIKEELLSDKVKKHIKDFVKDDLLGEEIQITSVLESILDDRYEDFLDNYVSSISSEINAYVEGILNNASLRQMMNTKVAGLIPYNMVIGEGMSSKNQMTIMSGIQSNYEGICGFVIDQLKQEGAKAKIGQLIGQIVSEKVGPLGAMFVNPDEMAESIVVYVEDLLADEETKSALLESGGKAITLVSEQKLSALLSMKDYITIVESITEIVVKEIFVFIESLDLKAMVRPVLEKILHKPILLSETDKNHFEKQVEHLYVTFVNNNIPTFLETFRVDEIVENEIARFSVQEVEKLIFDIIDQELKTITLLGGVLGFIIGLVYIII